MSDKKKALCGIFDRASATYDSVGPRFFTYFGKKIVEHAALKKNARVLDVATGRGASLYPALSVVGPDGFVSGIDLSESMVKRTSDELAGKAIPNAAVQCMDAEYLSFPDASFDHVICGFCIFFFPEPERAMKEMFRVLKSNGGITITTWGVYPTRDWHIELAKKHLPENSSAPALPQQGKKRPFEDPQDVYALLNTTGFTHIATVCEDKEFIYANEEEWWATQYSHGIRATLEQVEKTNGPAGLDRFKKDALKYLQTMKHPAGFSQTMKVYYTTAIKP